MSELAQLFTDIRSSMAACADQSVKDYALELGTIHRLDEDLGLWSNSLPEVVADQIVRARRELAFAEHAAASGLYRQAFSSLRLFLELSFAAVYFSANEYERRRWMSDRIDFSWSRALDPDDGVLSKAFVQEFNETLVDLCSPYAQAASAAYRYCSQFVHGKASASWQLPDSVEYNEELLQSWCHHAKSSGEAVQFLILVRFGDSDDRLSNTHHETILDRFGHHEEVRELIGN